MANMILSVWDTILALFSNESAHLADTFERGQFYRVRLERETVFFPIRIFSRTPANELQGALEQITGVPICSYEIISGFGKWIDEEGFWMFAPRRSAFEARPPIPHHADKTGFASLWARSTSKKPL